MVEEGGKELVLTENNPNFGGSSAGVVHCLTDLFRAETRGGREAYLGLNFTLLL